jgi:hypothetical protein
MSTHHPASRQTPPTGLWFTPWSGNLLASAFDADSDQCLTFLCPRIGPSAVLILHRLSSQLRNERLIWWDLPELAKCFGLGSGDVVGMNHPLWKAIVRLTMFGYLRQPPGHPEVYEVRTSIPPLSRAHVERLPVALQATAPSV